MAFTISYVIQAVNSFTPSANQISNSVARLRDRFVALGQTMGRVGSRMRDMGGSMTARVTAPLGLLGGAALVAAANLETMEVGFRSILGSASAANAFMKELTTFTAKTPFQLPGVGTAAKMLLGFGVEADQVIKTMTSLGNVASASGADLGDMARIFGNIKVAGGLTGDTFNQLAERGVPIIKVLSKQMGVAEGAVKDMAGEGKISLKDMTKAFATMNAKGGFAFDAMANQSKTLAGVFSTFKDNVNLSLGSVGEQLNKTLDITGTLEKFTAVIARMGQAFVKFSENNPRLAKFIIILVAIAAALGPVLGSIGFMAIGVSALIPIIVSLGTALVAAFAFIISPIGLVVAGIALVVAGAVLLVKNWDWVKEKVGGVINWLAKLITENNPFQILLKGLFFLIEKLTGFDLLSFLPSGLVSFLGLGPDEPKTPTTADTGLATAGASKNETDITIKLADREGLVQSVSSSSSGSGSTNVGVNMP